MAQRLERLGIVCVRDLLFHLPIRYQDRTRIRAIGSLRSYEEVLVEGNVELTQVQYGRRRSLLTRISDGTGALTLRFFHFSRAQQANLSKGARLRCYGEVRPGPVTLEIIHPEYRCLRDDTNIPIDTELTPVYPTTEGLHQASLRRLTGLALSLFDENAQSDPRFADCLPERLQARFPSLGEAIRYVHRPPAEADTSSLTEGRHAAQLRLSLDELLAHHLSLRRRRQQIDRNRAPVLADAQELTAEFLHGLSFQLSSAQIRVVAEIRSDLKRGRPMMRLLQGDVGSGKTVVAAIAALQALEASYQVAFMAPTELLAEQHLRSFRQWFEPLGIPVLWLSGKLSRVERRDTLQQIAATSPALILGTHALFQSEVAYRRLALVIVDEQHRFGVHQRLQLRAKGTSSRQLPHQLVMTATPIPRTLAMAAYADLDSSVLDELPAGRQPVSTSVMPDTRREDIINRIFSARREHRQIYWVCTLIEDSEALQCQAATDTATELSESLGNSVSVGLIHGRMKPGEKDSVMQGFVSGRIDLLVATTVIEVGVDVPNASLMIIENAERLGLSQLHQLRGRIGRGRKKSDCILLYHPPLSDAAKQRLAIMRQTTNGFEIAQRDLEIRGPGELLGTRQAGMLQFRIADLNRDSALIEELPKLSELVLSERPDCVDLIIDRWLGNVKSYVDA